MTLLLAAQHHRKDRKDFGLLSLGCGKWICTAKPMWELKPRLHPASPAGLRGFWQVLDGFY